MKHSLTIFTEYGQFYIADLNNNPDLDTLEFWNEEAFADRLAIDNGLLAVSVANDEAIAQMEVEVVDSRIIDEDMTHYDHVVEGSIEIKSGKLQIQDCPTSQVELELEVTPVWYRVWVGPANLDKAYQDNPEDKYYIKVWKEEPSIRTVLKRYEMD